MDYSDIVRNTYQGVYGTQPGEQQMSAWTRGLDIGKITPDKLQGAMQNRKDISSGVSNGWSQDMLNKQSAQQAASAPWTSKQTGITYGQPANQSLPTRQQGTIASQSPGAGQSSPMGGLLGLIKGITNAPANISGFANNISQMYSGNQTNTPGGNVTPGQNTITMPSMSNENAPGWIDELSQGIPNFFDAYENYQALPGQIDEWSQNAMNRQRATGEQVSGIFNQVGNQRAGSGIMGGTEHDNALSQMMTNLARIYGDNRTNIEMNANSMKANAIAGLPGTSMMPINAMAGLYGQNAADQQNWASLAANLLNTGY